MVLFLCWQGGEPVCRQLRRLLMGHAAMLARTLDGIEARDRHEEMRKQLTEWGWSKHYQELVQRSSA